MFGPTCNQNNPKWYQIDLSFVDLCSISRAPETQIYDDICRYPPLSSLASRNAPVRNAFACTDGGFVNLQSLLVRGARISCKSCLEFLTSVGVCAEELPKILAGEKVEAAPNAKEESKEEPSDAKAAQLEKWDDPMDWVRSLAPVLTVMPPGYQGRAVPVRCNVCRSKRQPDGKLIDLTTTSKARTIYHYVQQHLSGQMHTQNCEKVKPKPEIKQEEPQAYGGLRLLDKSLSAVAAYKAEFEIWAMRKPQARFAKHQYWRDASSGEWHVRHSACKAVDPKGVCPECRKLGGRRAVLQVVLKFAFKYTAAKPLSARLFGGEGELNRLTEEIKGGNLYGCHQTKMDRIMSLTDGELQQLVRSAFMYEAPDEPRATHMDFVNVVARPCMKINVSKVGGAFAELLSRMTACLASGQLSEMEEVNARIAAAALSGRLENHPMVHGLTISAVRLLEKQADGIEGLKGRPRDVSQTEYNLVADAGLSLAIAGGNATLARSFGQRLGAGRVTFDQLNERDLPRPALSLRFEGLLKENMDSIDRRLPTVADMPTRRLFVAFDATYLQPCLMQCTVQGKVGLVGGAWQPRGEDHSFYPLDQPFDIQKIQKARLMLLESISMCLREFAQILLSTFKIA